MTTKGSKLQPGSPPGGKSHRPNDPRDASGWEDHDVKIRMQMYTESIHSHIQPFPYSHFIFITKQIFFCFQQKLKQKSTIAKKLNYFGDSANTQMGTRNSPSKQLNQRKNDNPKPKPTKSNPKQQNARSNLEPRKLN